VPVVSFPDANCLFCAPGQRAHSPGFGYNRRGASLTVYALIHCRGDVRPRSITSCFIATKLINSSSRQLSGSADEVCKEFAIRDRGLAVLFPAARRLNPLGSRRLSQTRELVELRVHIHEWISVIMRAAQKDRGNVVHGKCNDYPKRPGKMRNADLGQKIVA
jgi:hypothetical protein